MGQFKPMVKMETTEPSVILKLKKGGHVSSDKDENGHTNMKGAGFKAKYSEEACEGDSPKKPPMADRRKAMSGALLNSKKGGKAEKKAMGGMMGAPAMPAPAMDPRKAAMAKAMMARRRAGMGAAAPAAPMAAPAAPMMKKGGKAMKHDDAAQDRTMIKKAMAGKKFAAGGRIGAVMDKTTVKGNEGAYTKTKMSTAKDSPGYNRYAAGGTVEGNAGAYAKTKMSTAKTSPGYNRYAEGGAAKKHFATGGSVSTGSAVAMPKRPVSKPVSNTAQSGTFKEGGKVRKFQVGGGTGDMGTDMTGGGYDKVYTDQTEDNTKTRESILGLPNRLYSASKRLLGIKPDAGAGRGNVNPPLVRKSGGSA